LTPEERRWWEIERLREMKRLRLRSALPLSLMLIASILVYRHGWNSIGGWTHAIFVGSLTGFGMAWAQWRMGERDTRTKAVLGRRVREALLAEGNPVDACSDAFKRERVPVVDERSR
jgi:hypothetical protein